MLERVITYYDNGKIREEYYVDSSRMKQGEYKAYHSNGKLHVIYNYVDGKIQGEYKEYYKNGKPDIICNYVNDMKQGEYKAYHSNGKLRAIFNCVNGKIQGEYKEYHSGGELFKHKFYNKGNEVDLSDFSDQLTEYELLTLRILYA